MKKKRIDVKLSASRFTYDPEVLGEGLPVALQSRCGWGAKDGVAYMMLSVSECDELRLFLLEVEGRLRLERACREEDTHGE
jgi:hypothetical protein